MKGGKTPIHVQRWCPADFQADEHVRLLYARRDWRTLTFYRTFLDVAFMQGGDLPAEPASLAAMLGMPVADVRKALAFCVDRLIHDENGRLFQGRLRRDVAAELEFRETQRARANMRWHPDGSAAALPEQKRRHSPPSPTPAPITDTPLPPASGGPVENSRGTNGNGHRPTARQERTGQAAKLLALWLGLAKDHGADVSNSIPLDARDRIAAELRKGRPYWQLAGSIAEQVRNALLDDGAIDSQTKWPPDGWLEPSGVRESGT